MRTAWPSRRDKNAAGKAVNQMMFNVQVLGGGWEGNGGDGWLRILEFMPDGRTIQVRTYSPLFRHIALDQTPGPPHRRMRPL